MDSGASLQKNLSAFYDPLLSNVELNLAPVDVYSNQNQNQQSKIMEVIHEININGRKAVEKIKSQGDVRYIDSGRSASKDSTPPEVIN